MTRIRHDAIEGWEYVHLDMPDGGEDIARAFYGRLLGLREVPKLRNPASHRGIWFQLGSIQLHLGRGPDWPARTAVPLLPVHDLRTTIDALVAAGHKVNVDVQSGAAFARAIAVDPFGNRIELMHTAVTFRE
jgi:predicted enzyme related to lactoylglutathione lyase